MCWQLQSLGVQSRFVTDKHAFVRTICVCVHLIVVWQAPSPRLGDPVDWEACARKESKRCEENEKQLEWLQGQWLDPHVKMKLDAYEAAMHEVRVLCDICCL